MKREKLLSDALIIAMAPLMGYLILKAYYIGAESNLRLPSNIGTVNIYQSVELGFTILLILIVTYSMSELLSATIKPRSALTIRLRRIAQVSIFLAGCFVLAGLQRSNSSPSLIDMMIACLSAMLVISVPFLLRDIGYPLLKYRKVRKQSERLTRHRSDETFRSPIRYYKSFLNPTNIGFLLIPVLFIYVIAYNTGKSSTDTNKSREYIIIDSSPKQIVLINYGDSWVTAKYDDSYPGRPAYRQEYKIIDKQEMTKNKFTVKQIPQLYVYD